MTVASLEACGNLFDNAGKPALGTTINDPHHELTSSQLTKSDFSSSGTEEIVSLETMTGDSKHVHSVDATNHAIRMHFALPMRIEKEAFGVLVTRRPMATEKDLTPYESARLLDLLVHAAEFCGQCDDEPKQFNMWVLQSDTRDGKARNLWLQLQIVAGGYLICLTDE